MKELTKLVFTEKDLKELIAEKFNLNLSTIILNVNHYDGDQRGPSYTTIIVEGEKNQEEIKI